MLGNILKVEVGYCLLGNILTVEVGYCLLDKILTVEMGFSIKQYTDSRGGYCLCRAIY